MRYFRSLALVAAVAAIAAPLAACQSAEGGLTVAKRSVCAAGDTVCLFTRIVCGEPDPVIGAEKAPAAHSTAFVLVPTPATVAARTLDAAPPIAPRRGVCTGPECGVPAVDDTSPIPLAPQEWRRLTATEAGYVPK